MEQPPSTSAAVPEPITTTAAAAAPIATAASPPMSPTDIPLARTTAPASRPIATQARTTSRTSAHLPMHPAMRASQVLGEAPDGSPLSPTGTAADDASVRPFNLPAPPRDPADEDVQPDAVPPPPQPTTTTTSSRRAAGGRRRPRYPADYYGTDSEDDLVQGEVPDRAWLAAQLNPVVPDAAAKLMAAANGQQGVTVDRVVDTAALIDHAVVLHQLLHRTRHGDPATDALYLVRAENRYVKWLFMLERLRAAGDEAMVPAGRVVPPLDVAVMWLAHLTAVRHYVEDVARLFDDALLYLVPPMARLRALIEQPEYMDRASAQLWESFTGEPFTLAFDDNSPFYLSCPTCTASVMVPCADYLRLKLEPGFHGIVCAPGTAEGGAGCGTVLTASFLSAVRYVNDFKGSQRESNTYVAGTLLNPVSGKPNHYLSKQIVLYLAQAPSVVDLYGAIAVPIPTPPELLHPIGVAAPSPVPEADEDGDEVVTLPGNATPPTGPGSSAATLGGGSGADSAASSEVGPTPHASASAGIHHHRPQRTNTAASTSSGFGFWNPAGGSSSHKAQRSQRLDPWRDISNVLFRLEVDLYALELEDHRLISWHIRAAIDRMERCYRDLVTPLSLDLVARVRGHWRTTATLVLAWLTYAGQPDPSAVPAAAAAGAANASSDNPDDSDDESGAQPAGPAPRPDATNGSATASPLADVDGSSRHAADAVMAMLPAGMVGVRVRGSGKSRTRRGGGDRSAISVWIGGTATANPGPNAVSTLGRRPATADDVRAAAHAVPSGVVAVDAPVPPPLGGTNAAAYKLTRSKSVPGSAQGMVAGAGGGSLPRSASGSIRRSFGWRANSTSAASSSASAAGDAADPSRRRARSTPPGSGDAMPDATAPPPVPPLPASNSADSSDAASYIQPPPGSPWDDIDGVTVVPASALLAALDPAVLTASTVRYHKFLLLQRSHAGLYAQRMALPIDLVLCNWTHLLYPPRYVRFAGTHFGRLITYEFATPQALDAALRNTARKWRRRYRERLDPGFRPKLSWSDKIVAVLDRVVGRLVSSGPM
ncbi:hypothetical protein H9P43_009757 [Blastocladiella emersonii ATCC 22665]|nr:hypothetical protein H9P43_009757 [Blastocladiella emersonii ATCC 22665]